MRYGELFAGIGGMSLGLERAGMAPAWFVEIDPHCRRVLSRHWPNVPQYGDVRDVGAQNLKAVDLVAGGFPCPVVSQAARGRNVAEWMWPEFSRIVCELRPRYVVVENVAGLLYRERGFGTILGDLARMGYDAEWRVLRSSWLGAPHHRARLWLVANAHGYGEPDLSLNDEASRLSQSGGAVRDRRNPPRDLRVADGTAPWMERLRVVGNSVDPAVAEWIGHRIMAIA